MKKVKLTFTDFKDDDVLFMDLNNPPSGIALLMRSDVWENSNAPAKITVVIDEIGS